jgi:eukaryotic-like serine/threonine-protein kinase
MGPGNPQGAGGGPNSARDPLIGALVNGKFRVQSAIARGGMGRIYYAIQEPLGRPVALKVVQGDGQNEHESQFLKRFLQEASILAKLQHPNVVTLFDYGRVEGPVEQYFIAMEYLAGETLSQRMKTRGVFSAQEALVLTRQILRGLREAHVRGIVHRDLKPSNIILVREADGAEIVKLVDFGIGKVMELGGDQDLTQDGYVVGTPRYMAPEQFDGSAVPASDLYALGSILYQGITGQLPFKGATMSEFMVAKFAQQVLPFRQVNSAVSVPVSYETFVLKLLERRPEDRPTMEQLFAHLAHCEMEVFGHVPNATGNLPAWSGQMPSTTPAPIVIPSNPPTGQSSVAPPVMGITPHPISTSARPPPPHGSRSGLVLAAVGLPLLLLAAGGAALWQSRRAPAAAATMAPPGTSSTAQAAASASAPSATFTLTIDSSPPGATVTEGDKPLGTTPLKLPIERSSVTAGRRTFLVHKDGYLASTVEQGPSEDNVRSHVSLANDPTQAVKPVGNGGGAKNGGGGGGKRPPPGDGLDIRRER